MLQAESKADQKSVGSRNGKRLLFYANAILLGRVTNMGSGLGQTTVNKSCTAASFRPPPRNAPR
jgi:hypothetical protein